MKKSKGLKRLPYDGRDLSFHRTFGAVPLTGVPDFYVLPSTILDQNGFNACTGFSAAADVETETGIPHSPFYYYAKEAVVYKQLSLDGYDMRTKMKVRSQFGSLPLSKTPANLKNEHDFSILANPANWPEALDAIAAVYKTGSYYAIDGPYDIFDSIRSAMWLQKGIRRCADLGIMWMDEWDSAKKGVILDGATTDGGGHDIKCGGWTDRYLSDGVKFIDGKLRLAIQNSWSKTAGDQGWFYFTREQANKYLVPSDFGAFIWVDALPLDSAQTISTMKNIINQMKQLIIKINNYLHPVAPQPTPTPAPVPSPVPPAPAPHVSLIPTWAVAISKQEGDSVNSRSRLNGNPGNLKYSAYTKSLGATGKDANNFCKFVSWIAGMKALQQFLTDAANNALVPYKNCTLDQFTTIYAQPPNKNYVNGVAAYMNVAITIPIKELL